MATKPYQITNHDVWVLERCDPIWLQNCDTFITDKTWFQNGVIPYGYKTADDPEMYDARFQNGVIPYGYKTPSRILFLDRQFQNGVIPYGYKTEPTLIADIIQFQNGVIPYGYKTKREPL